MKRCPDCGQEILVSGADCPSCKKGIRAPFAIFDFIWANFRLFAMIGITGTMISLIPNMGSQVLGDFWIVHNGYLPVTLSMIIFFGTVFMTICFLMIFSLIFRGRETESVSRLVRITPGKGVTWHEGDLQRFILLFCLVPMWFSLTIFFLLLIPMIPNRYSWVFAVIVGLTCIPLAIYSFLGWKLGKIMTNRIPVLMAHPRFSIGVCSVLVIGVLVLIPYAFPAYFDNSDTFSGDVRIHPAQGFFSPRISSAKGLQLEITNLSSRELALSRQTWAADYGYFISVDPSTSEVQILGNPVFNDTARDIYWTYSGNDQNHVKKPVTIDFSLYRMPGNEKVASSSVFLTWYSDDIISVNSSY
jgi:hypothetical protein